MFLKLSSELIWGLICVTELYSFMYRESKVIILEPVTKQPSVSRQSTACFLWKRIFSGQEIQSKQSESVRRRQFHLHSGWDRKMSLTRSANHLAAPVSVIWARFCGNGPTIQ